MLKRKLKLFRQEKQATEVCTIPTEVQSDERTQNTRITEFRETSKTSFKENTLRNQ